MSKPPRVFIGIDPGSSGGFAIITTDGVETYPMIADLGDLWEFFKNCKFPLTGVSVYMEQVGGFIGTRAADDGGFGDGKKRNLASAHTMFVFGRGVGHIDMALAGNRLWESTIHITPRKWQAEFGIGPKGKGETQTQFKNRIKAKAVELFPDVKVTLKTADALLIALYGKRIYERT